MHVSPGNFTWGNTASSCIAVLPNSESTVPVFWWTPGPPCNGCYVPFFVHGTGLPEIVSRAGTFDKKVVPPPKVVEDAFSAHSYWWLFNRLMEKVKGDPVKSLPGHYEHKNRMVRARFDAAEEAFATQLVRVMAEATEGKKGGQEEASRRLDAFTRDCVNRAVDVLQELLNEFD